jgi:hypothetical protein
VIADLQTGGHSYFGRWNPKYDPKLHGAISGRREFVTGQGGAAKAGETSQRPDPGQRNREAIG